MRQSVPRVEQSQERMLSSFKFLNVCAIVAYINLLIGRSQGGGVCVGVCVGGCGCECGLKVETMK